jgi:hypothetical protein
VTEERLKGKICYMDFGREVLDPARHGGEAVDVYWVTVTDAGGGDAKGD